MEPPTTMSDKSDVIIPSERPDVTSNNRNNRNNSNNTPDIQDNTSSSCNNCNNAKDENTKTTSDDDPSIYRIKSPLDSNSNISEEEEVQSEQRTKNKNKNEGNGSPSASGRSVPLPHMVNPFSSSIASPELNNNDDDNDVENGTNYNPSPRMQSTTTTTTSRRECFHWWLPFLTWSRQRIIVAIMGCFSSSVVLAIRLILDNNPTTTYKIHSVIIFLDMVLIHLFTYSKWLSVSGEALTVGMALSYTYTHETIFEFIETTMIAVLCSFHMILSRNKHWEHESQLQDELASLRDSIRSLHDGSHDHLIQSLPSSTHNVALINRRSSSRNSSTLSRALYSNAGDTSDSNDANGSSLILPHHHHHHHRKNNKTRMHLCCGHFFEHFLDGSAGVMYTSFLGLIIDEAINYGRNNCG